MTSTVYLAASDEPTLSAFTAYFTNVLGPAQGRAAIPAGTDQFGNAIPAIAAVGDPALWYACIEAPFDISASLPSGITVALQPDATDVLGVWEQ